MIVARDTGRKEGEKEGDRETYLMSRLSGHGGWGLLLERLFDRNLQSQDGT